MAGMGWGGVIASALAGGAASAMTSIAGSLDDQMKAEIQAKRDAQLSKLRQEEHAANKKLDAQVELDSMRPKAEMANQLANEFAPDANARAAAATRSQIEPEAEKAGAIEKAKEAEKTHTLSAGQRLVKGDKVIIEGEPRVLTEEEAEYWNARTEAERARAGFLTAKGDNAGAGGGKEKKPAAEKWKESGKGSEGGKLSVEEHTGYTQEVVPGTKERPEERRWLGPNKPAVPATEARVIYRDPSGKQVTRAEFEAALQKTPGVVNSGVAASGATSKSLAEIRAEATAALARPGAKVAAIKARFKELTGKDY